MLKTLFLVGDVRLEWFFYMPGVLVFVHVLVCHIIFILLEHRHGSWGLFLSQLGTLFVRGEEKHYFFNRAEMWWLGTLSMYYVHPMAKGF